MEVELMAQFTEHTSRDRAQNIIKRKRTKRQRPWYTTSGNTTHEDYCSIDNSTPDRCQSMVMSSEEDEDMANCLIMLAQSHVSPAEKKSDPIHHKTTEKMITTITDVYECKTCNRTFPSFQALGGHRASHKKLKLNVEDKKSSSMNNPSHEDNDQQKTVTEDRENTVYDIIYNNNDEKFPLPTIGYVQTGNNKIKVHECSICGSEFSSGQALGGHMRKHRPVPVSVNRVTESVTEKSPGGSTSCKLSLDLNFPPPEVVDDVVQSKFQLGSSQQHLVFSAPALVDCHY
ncbi:putative transcription factor C2H2 family [Helianthus annuus]|nr:putative transcription factor C2H2 family [Helianthus annuus]